MDRYGLEMQSRYWKVYNRVVEEGKYVRGTVLAVCISEDKGEKKHDIQQGYFAREQGLINDAHSGSWHRQVSLLGIESINKMRARG